ncbi:MAG: ribosome assembly RNA-binding protein YhbY [Sandaracinaceae bacterium]|nr:ribosome assembly RNA-binding protein YhbY [Sandaracinaceae bacterium]
MTSTEKESLSGKQRQYLRGLAHALAPIVQIGKDGITESLTAAVDRALIDHELIKVRVLESSPVDRRECEEALAAALDAHGVGTIGRIVMLYRRHPEKPKISLPKK